MIGHGEAQPSDAFVRFVSEAVRWRLAVAQRRGEYPTRALRDELGAFVSTLVVGSGEVTSGQDGSPHARPAIGPQAGAVDGDGPRSEAVGLIEAGRLLGVSHSTIKRRVAAGDLDSTTIGRRRVIPRTAIDDMLGRSAP